MTDETMKNVEQQIEQIARLKAAGGMTEAEMDERIEALIADPVAREAMLIRIIKDIITGKWDPGPFLGRVVAKDDKVIDWLKEH